MSASCRHCEGALDGLSWCAACRRGARLRAERWAAVLLDEGPVEVAGLDESDRDPLGWPGYLQARAEAPGDEAVRVWQGAIAGHGCVLIAFDFDHLGGSMGSGVGDRVVAAFEAATTHGLPVVTVTATGGARMQEGMRSLVQMGRTTGAAERHAAAGLLQITVVSDPTTGGVWASFASRADLLVAEPGAYVGFAGPRVAKSLAGAQVAADVNRAEFAERHGLVDAVVGRPELRGWLARALSAIAPARPSPLPSGPSPMAPATETPASAWARVQGARDPLRPRAAAYLSQLTDLVRLSGDRAGGVDEHVFAGLGRLGGRPLGLIALDRKPVHPPGYRTAQRLLALAGRLGLPVLTLVDTPGADPSPQAEAAGQAASISATFAALLGVPTPTVCLVTGEGGSGGALALAVTDRLLLQAGAIFSVIAPEGAAAILHRDPDRAPEVAEQLRLLPEDLVDLGIADGVTADDPAAAMAAVAGTLDALAALPDEERLAARARRYGGS